ncbi:MAG: replication-relaxation family protein [Bacteriovoracia bacterium]
MLVERDRLLFTRIFENRVMSAAQIETEFFSSVARQTFAARLLKLTRYGFLDRKVVSPLDAKSYAVYSITPKALAVVKARYPFRIVKDYCKSDSVEHDVELVNVRNRLRALRSVAAHYTENMLQACEDFTNTDSLAAFKKQNTDAALAIRKNGKITVVGLEFERSEKAFGRYTKKLFSYYADSSTAVVFYVCRSLAIQRVVARAEASIMGSNRPRCFYALLENVLKQSEKCTFKNLKGDTITLD